jgi:hypothetical protein
MNEIEQLSSRIERLERDVRRNRTTRNALLVAVGGLLIAAFQTPIQEGLQAKVIKAQEFQLVDAKGAVRGRFGADNHTPAAVSLTMRPNGIDETLRLLSGPERSELTLDGDDDSGAVWLVASHDRADAGLLTPGGGTKTAVVWLEANRLSGSVVVSKMENVEVEGGPGVKTIDSWRWPAAPAHGAKGGK